MKVCGLAAAWYERIEDAEVLIRSLKNARRKLHVFTFFQRVPDVIPYYKYHVEPYSVAVIKLTNYADWWNNSIGQNARQAVKRSKKNGIEIRVSNLDLEFVKGISSIYNETPIRQGKRFPHFKDSLEKIQREAGTFMDRSVLLGAYHGNELVGFAKIVFEDQFTDVLHFLSKNSYRSMGVNNALLAKIIEICSERGVGYIAYGDLGSGGLDDFKRRNGFVSMDLPRYYVPLSWAGKVALKLNLHRKVSDLLPYGIALSLKMLRKQLYGLIERYVR